MRVNCPPSNAAISWPKLIKGTLVKRYKRFLADVVLDGGQRVTAHCPNSGSMKGCSEPGRTVYLSAHNSPKRKLPYTWEIIDMGTSLVGVNTLVPNRLVRDAIAAGLIRGLGGYEDIKTEIRYGTNSRVDVLLRSGNRLCYVEVKNCTLVENGVALFPDAVTTRGLKHLVDLQEEVRRGHRAVMFYLIQRMDAEIFAPADRIDPAYAEELRKAVKNGVEILAYDVCIDLKKICLNRQLQVDLKS